jgi:preprotein translocase subunit SecF
VFELVPPDTRIDFIGRWKLCVGLSVALILVSAAALPLRGVRLGIDFAGGTEVQVRVEDPRRGEEGPIRDALQGIGIAEPSVVRFGLRQGGEFLIRFRGALDETDANRLAPLRDALTARVGPVEIERVESVGPKVGAELRRDGALALGISFLLILIYVAFRFSSRFAPGAVVALVHDVLVTSGVWVLLGFEFDLRVLAALLTITGYSLNDTIVIYDRIRETLRVHTNVDLPEVVNRSVNATLSRTILTSGATLLSVLALWAVGGDVIRPFAIAMTIGIVAGTYSTVYIASPMLLLLEGRRARREAAPARPGSRRARA